MGFHLRKLRADQLLPWAPGPLALLAALWSGGQVTALGGPAELERGSRWTSVPPAQWDVGGMPQGPLERLLAIDDAAPLRLASKAPKAQEGGSGSRASPGPCHSPLTGLHPCLAPSPRPSCSGAALLKQT